MQKRRENKMKEINMCNMNYIIVLSKKSNTKKKKSAKGAYPCNAMLPNFSLTKYNSSNIRIYQPM